MDRRTGSGAPCGPAVGGPHAPPCQRGSLKGASTTNHLSVTRTRGSAAATTEHIGRAPRLRVPGHNQPIGHGDKDGGESDEDGRLDALEGPESARRLVGEELMVAMGRQARW